MGSSINCAAIPESLAESILFGHEKGAFTGAISRRMGKFKSADQGTIFLDEIGVVSPQIQAKLLRVLESGEIETVGSEKPVQVKVRVIAATNKDLEAAQARGQFRSDLFHRLNQLFIRVPPLRERKEDIPLLVRHVLENDPDMKERRVSISSEAVERLMNYSFPGNVRELRQSLQRAAVDAGWRSSRTFPGKPLSVATSLSSSFRKVDPRFEVTCCSVSSRL